MNERQVDFILAALRELKSSGDLLLYNVHLKGGHTILNVHSIEYLHNGLIRMIDAKFASMCADDAVIAISRIG